MHGSSLYAYIYLEPPYAVGNDPLKFRERGRELPPTVGTAVGARPLKFPRVKMSKADSPTGSASVHYTPGP